MRIATLAAGGVPNPDAGGAVLTQWTVISHLLELGHEVIVCPLVAPDYIDPAGATLDERIDQVTALGAAVRPIRSRAHEVGANGHGSTLRSVLAPTDVDLFPHLVDGEEVEKTVRALDPDAVWAYHWEALAASRPLRGHVPRLATVVDLPHLAAFYRWRMEPKSISKAAVVESARVLVARRRQPRLMVRLLGECEASADFAAHHAAWLRRRGAVECEYLRTPIDDAAGPNWLERRRRHASQGRPRILFIGHLRGTSTLDGLALLADGILPLLDAQLGQDGYELRVVGGYDLPPRFATFAARPNVSLIGHQRRADDEFSGADVLLVPTAIPLGTRVRILSGFSFGCPVVAHESNSLGIPELAHERNILLGRDEHELVEGVLRVLGDADLAHELELAGRSTFERFFAAPVAAGRLAGILSEIARRTRPRHEARGARASRAPEPT